MPEYEYEIVEDEDPLYEYEPVGGYQRVAPPTIGENALLIGAEVAPAIIGGILGGIPGGAVGGGIGNYVSQQLRQDMGFSDRTGLGELGAAVATGAIPVGRLASLGWKAKAAARGVQGATIATGETFARTVIDEARMPTEQELKNSALFGFAIGGALGGVEAKFFNDVTGTKVAKAGDKEEDLVAKLKEDKGITQEEGEKTVKDVSGALYNGLVNWQKTAGDNELQRLQNILADEAAGGEAGLQRRSQLELEGLAEGYRAEEAIARQVPPESTPNYPVMRQALSGQIQATRNAIADLEQRLAQETDPNVRPGIELALQKNREILANAEQELRQMPTGPAKMIPPTKPSALTQLPTYPGVTRPPMMQAGEVRQPDELTQLNRALAAEEAGDLSRRRDLNLEEMRQRQQREAAQQQRLEGQRAAEGQLLRQQLKQEETTAASQIPSSGVIAIPPTPKSAPDSQVALELKQAMTAMDDTPIIDTKRLDDIQGQIATLSKQSSLKKAQRKKLKNLRKQEANMLNQMPQDNLPLGITQQYNYISKLEDEVDHIEDLLETATGRERKALMVERSDLRKAIQKERQFLTKEEESAFNALPTNKFKEYLMSGALSSGAGLAMFLGDEEGEADLASMDMLFRIGLLAALGAGGVKAMRAMARNKVRTVKGKDGKQKIHKDDAPIEFHESNAKQIDNDDIVFMPPSKLQNVITSIQELAGSTLQPLSRTAKSINPKLAEIFKDFERKVMTKRKEFKNAAMPFWTKLNKAIGKNLEDKQALKMAWLNGDHEKIAQLSKKHSVDYSGYADYRRASKEVHRQAVEEASMDMGYIEGHNPRVLKARAYPQFRKELERRGLRREATDIDRGIEEYAKKHGMDVDQVSAWEKAQIASRIFTGVRGTSMGGQANFSKQRLIGQIDDWMMDYYEDPLESLQKYMDNAAYKIESRKFLGKQLGYAPGERNVELDAGIRDSYAPSVGAGVQVSDSLAGKLAQSVGKDLGITNDVDIQKIQDLLQARFRGVGGNEFLDALRTTNYFGTIANFGTTITQLMDLVNSVYFHGWDNTTKAMLRSNRRDFFSELGFDPTQGTDWHMTSGGLNKALEKVLNVTQFNRLDKWAKNTALNAAHINWRKKIKKDYAGTVAELQERFGDDAYRIAKDLDEWTGKLDGNMPTPDGIQMLLFSELSNIMPTSRFEMPEAASGKFGPIVYQLKSYMIKQLDIYREIASKDAAKAASLYRQGKKQEAAKVGARAAGKLALYGGYLAAAGASTDFIKDKIYGRPIETDEMLQNNLLRLAMLNRYHIYSMERDGAAKTLLQMALPATTVFDRLGKDIGAYVAGEDVKGHSLQGTILDLIYWHGEGMGGFEKARQ